MPPGGIQTHFPKLPLLKSGSRYEQVVYVELEIIWKDIEQILK
jgi:hypothetical protein